MKRGVIGTLCLALTLTLFGEGEGHGRLIQPPARSTAWRYGFSTLHDYNDNQLFCGGAAFQRSLGGKCGICGDPWTDPQPREHENGGKYGGGVKVATYTSGQNIEVKVELTAAHEGWFEFRLCPLEDTSRPATEECLNRNLLRQPNGNTRYEAGNSAQVLTIPLALPQGLFCDHCVLQWRYHTGNSWGRDEEGEGLGHGPQEEFYGCADITITQAGGQQPGKEDEQEEGGEENGGEGEEGVEWESEDDENDAENEEAEEDGDGQDDENVEDSGPSTGDRPGHRIPNSEANKRSNVRCYGTGLWAGRENINTWCNQNCLGPVQNCPDNICACFEVIDLENPINRPDPESPDDKPQFQCGFRDNPQNDDELDALCKGRCNPWTGVCRNKHCACQDRCQMFTAKADYGQDQVAMDLFCQLQCAGKGRRDCLPDICACVENTPPQLSCRGDGWLAPVLGFGDYCEKVCRIGNGSLCPSSCICN